MASIASTRLSWLFILLPSLVNGGAYRYPVAALSDNNHILVLCDRDHNLELFMHDYAMQTEEKILSSSYEPAGVQLLPDESGFSFINDGILCIKRFDRRFVHSVEPADPLYDIEYIHWLDNEWCYFHAKKAGRHGIYMMNAQGDVVTLREGDDAFEYLYPHIIAGILFCITLQHTNETTDYSICSGSLKMLMRHGSDWSEIVTIGTRPLTLLHMISGHEGFVLEYPPTRDADGQQFPFTCCYFFNSEGEWKHERLFVFSVPSRLLFDPQDRLYESILPLKPFYASGSIYYCSCDSENNKSNLYAYSMKTKKTELLKQENCSLCAPYIMNKNILMYGSEITDNDCDKLRVLQIDARP